MRCCLLLSTKRKVWYCTETMSHTCYQRRLRFDYTAIHLVLKNCYRVDSLCRELESISTPLHVISKLKYMYLLWDFMSWSCFATRWIRKKPKSRYSATEHLFNMRSLSLVSAVTVSDTCTLAEVGRGGHLSEVVIRTIIVAYSPRSSDSPYG